MHLAPNQISVSKLSDLKKVLATYKYPKSSVYTANVLPQPSMFSSVDEEYNRMRRRQVGPAFTQTGLSKVEKIVMDYGIIALKEKMESILESGENSFNYYYDFQGLTADVISKLSFGRSFGVLKHSNTKFLNYTNSLLLLGGLGMAFPFLKKIPFVLRRLHKDRDTYVKFVKESINQRRETLESDKEATLDILQMYLNSVNTTNKKPLSDEELVSECLIMLTAGTDTTSVTMTMLMHMYTLYPDVYNKVVEEVRSTFTDRSELITFSMTKEKLPYLIATVYECMRLSPIAAGTFFRDSSSEGIELSGIKVPKNIQMGMFIEGANKDETVWKSPDSFMPERFLGPVGESLKKEIVTFSHGVRICPGRK
ncbi:Cytochrome P450 3A12 [Smittium culicis]|uniref:Cytochrome P450 3A12 n=1 Tax=Smittium culicis TaxID=133412 RepID=A0A1R1XS56_9FUNG|nr:Cytochrome P450 3A12 [Smittium culicis]